ncbi:hypothetical protein VSS37_05855 [Candidatus Thiothrix sp. Deng01]|uniref:Uncharacterized protein n=1 Tax=Candidatus Thiothrix phosphatis TaxID=3112415 RepID=A0ABU6CV76_9GAMM|nr:hypothetical protein [Candidatus Thiothrix sp. Deng01]MEB4590496.1 hypothetical protein [Candidatus Thiothrix sp. Deng01]
MCDTEKQYMYGLKDLGTFTLNVNVDYTDAGQKEMRANSASNTLKTFKVLLANGDAIGFSGIVGKNDTSGGTDGKLEGSFEVRLRTRAQATPSGGSAGNA